MEKVRQKTWFKWRYLRFISQLAFVGSIIALSYKHLGFATKLAGPIDTYCPFGGVATLPTLAQTGEFVRRTGDTNIVLLVGLVLAVLVFGGAFCGWVCPLGSVFEWLYKLRSKIFKKSFSLLCLPGDPSLLLLDLRRYRLRASAGYTSIRSSRNQS